MKLWSRLTVPHAITHVHAMHISGFLAVHHRFFTKYVALPLSFFIVCYSYIFPLVLLLTVVLFL